MYWYTTADADKNGDRTNAKRHGRDMKRRKQTEMDQTTPEKSSGALLVGS